MTPTFRRTGTALAAVDDDGLAGPPAGNPASMTNDLNANIGDNIADTSEASFTGVLGGSVGGDGAGANGFSFARPERHDRDGRHRDGELQLGRQHADGDGSARDVCSRLW